MSNEQNVGRVISTIGYVCKSQTMPGIHYITGANATPEEVEKWKKAGYWKAHIVAIEVADE
jgi:hypothetical protein